MQLLSSTPAELRQALVTGAAVWRSLGRSCDDDAGPPPIVLQRALDCIDAHPNAAAWFVPRLFWVEEIGEIVGSARFKTPPDYAEGVEIGYGVGTRHQGLGYATAGVRLMIAEAFNHPSVAKIYATARPDNLASIRVLLKCGFKADDQGLDSSEGDMLRFHLFRA